MADLLREKQLREERGVVTRRLVALDDRAQRDSLTDEDRQQREVLLNHEAALTTEIEEINRFERQLGGLPMRSERHGLPGRDDFRTDPRREYEEERSTYDHAIGGWLKNAAGVPVDDTHVEACRSIGTSISSASMFVPWQRSLRPQIGRDWLSRNQPERRALGTQVGAAGGFTVGDSSFMVTLELAMLNASAALGSYEIMTTADGGDLPWPTSNDTDNEGELLGENTATDEDDVTFGQQVFRAYKGSSKMIRVASELMQDSSVNIASVIGGMIGQRNGRLLNRLTTVGTGASQPKGIMNSATVGVTTASASAITADEILDLIHSVDESYRTGAKFQMNDATILAVRKLKTGDGQYLWQDGLQAGQPNRLLGYEVISNRHIATIAASAKTIAFGAMNKYKVRLAGGVRLKRLVERYAEYDQEGFVSFLRFDGALLDAGTHPVKVLQMHA